MEDQFGLAQHPLAHLGEQGVGQRDGFVGIGLNTHNGLDDTLIGFCLEAVIYAIAAIRGCLTTDKVLLPLTSFTTYLE